MHNLGRQKYMILLYVITAFCLNQIASGVDPNEVIFWDEPGYSGYSFNWSLEPGMRHLAYGSFYSETSSIEVGSDVKVVGYRHVYFCGPSKVFENSIGYVGNYWNDEISSFIVFPKWQSAPMGVRLSQTAPNSVTGFEPESQFLPLPDYLSLNEAAYGGNFLTYVYGEPDMEYVLIQGDVEAEIFAEKDNSGHSIVLPPIANVCSDNAESEFDGYKYYRLSGCVLKNIGSMKVRQTGLKERSSAVGTSAGEFISEPASDQTTELTGRTPQIVDVSWKPNIGAIEVTFDQFPTELWSHHWEMYIDNQNLPMEAPAGSPNVRPNAELEMHPTGVLIGTLPWLGSLDATGFPCCGTIKFCIPGIGCTNEMEFNFAGEGCRTASPKDCGSGQESPTQQAPPAGSSDIVTGLVTVISELPVWTQPSSRTGIELEYNIDRPGMNLEQGYILPSPDPQICANDCSNNPDCKAFTYVKLGFRGPNSPPECWLKNGIPDPVPQEYCISGVK